jgi:hypothetical protein
MHARHRRLRTRATAICYTAHPHSSIRRGSPSFDGRSLRPPFVRPLVFRQAAHHTQGRSDFLRIHGLFPHNVLRLSIFSHFRAAYWTPSHRSSAMGAGSKGLCVGGFILRRDICLPGSQYQFTANKGFLEQVHINTLMTIEYYLIEAY